MEETGLIAWNKRAKTVLRAPKPDDFFPEEETDTLAQIIERSFMRRLLAGGAEAGMQINELELAREIGVGTTSVREFLIRFSRFGLIEKRRNSHWVLKGFTRAFALELTEIREMFELRSAAAFAALPEDSSVWADLDRLEDEHRQLAQEIATRFTAFSELDERFHRLIHRASRNRFIVDFYDVIAMAHRQSGHPGSGPLDGTARHPRLGLRDGEDRGTDRHPRRVIFSQPANGIFLRSAEFLGQPDEMPFRPADVAEPICVFISDHFAHQLCATLAEPF